MEAAGLEALGGEALAVVREIAAVAKNAGGRAWLVGGAVRDVALGAPAVKDADVEVFGVDPETLRRKIGERFHFDECGVSFGVMKLKGVGVDVSLPRRESKSGRGHRAFSVDADPHLTVKEAAERRDFTVNAMYLDPLTGEIQDPYGGMRDLERSVLRHVSGKFAEDPLRVLRGMQFVARFSLSPAPETVAVCREMDFEGLARERVFEEWSKLLAKGVRIGDGLEFLRATGWVRHFPELERLIGCEQNPKWHPEGDVWEHTKMCLDAFARRRVGDESEDVLVGLAVVCHDFGKPATAFRDPADGCIKSPGHDEAGVAPTISFLKRMTDEERLLKEIPPLVQCHMQPFAMWTANSGDSAVRRLARRVGRIDRLVRVARADSEGRPPEVCGGPTAGKDLEWLEEAAERLRVAHAAPKPLLMGRHLIEMGLKPSPRFGEILSACFEAQLDGKFSDLEGAIAHCRAAFPETAPGA